MRLNKLLNVNLENLEMASQGEAVDMGVVADELRESNEELVQLEQEEQTLEEMNQDIKTQEEQLEGDSEITIQDVVNSEVKMEQYSSVFSPYGYLDLKQILDFNCESFGGQTPKDMLRISLENKKKLQAIVMEAIEQKKTTIGQRFKDFFVNATKEYNGYLDKIVKEKDELKNSGKKELDTSRELSGIAKVFVTSDIVTVSAKNFENFIKKGDISNLIDVSKTNIKPKEWYVANDDRVFTGEKTANPKFFPLGVREKGTGTMQGRLRAAFKEASNDDKTLIVYGMDNSMAYSDSGHTIGEFLPMFNLDELSLSNSGIKNKEDVIKAIDKIYKDLKEAWNNIKSVTRESGSIKGELGLFNPNQRGVAFRNDLRLHQIRLARQGYHVVKELSSLLK